MSQTDRSAGRRLGLITIDEIVGGASNVLIAVLAAHAMPVSSFGLFGVVFVIYILVVGVARALISDPLLVHPAEAETRREEVIASACVLGIGLGALTVAVGLVARLVDPRFGDAVAVLGIGIPLLILQDLGRYIGFAIQRPSRALVLDTVWLVLVIGAGAAIIAVGNHSLAVFIAGWAGSGALSGVLLFWQERQPRVHFNLAWLRYTWPFAWRYLVSYTSTQGTGLAAAGAIGGIAGSRALGAIQGTVLLMRPFGTFQVAATAASVPDISRIKTDVVAVRRRAVTISGLTTTVAVVNAAILLLLPAAVGHVILGNAWSAARPLLKPISVQLLFSGLWTGARAALLGTRAIGRVMRVDVGTIAAVFVANVIGVSINGALGAMWAVAVLQIAVAGIWWVATLDQLASDGRLGLTPLVPLPMVEDPALD